MEATPQGTETTVNHLEMFLRNEKPAEKSAHLANCQLTKKAALNREINWTIRDSRSQKQYSNLNPHLLPRMYYFSSLMIIAGKTQLKHTIIEHLQIYRG